MNNLLKTIIFNLSLIESKKYQDTISLQIFLNQGLSHSDLRP